MPGTIAAAPGAKAVEALESAGFGIARIHGSHHIMRHPDRRVVVILVLGGQGLPKGTLRGILTAVDVKQALKVDPEHYLTDGRSVTRNLAEHCGTTSIYSPVDTSAH